MIFCFVSFFILKFEKQPKFNKKIIDKIKMLLYNSKIQYKNG